MRHPVTTRSSFKALDHATVDRIGERGMLLPDLINRGLAAHDQLKYYLLLLQTACEYAQAPNQKPLTLRSEREASGVFDRSLDGVVAASRMLAGEIVQIPGAAVILEQVFKNLRQMLEPVTVACTWRSDLRERSDMYERRLAELVAQAPSCSDDQLPPGVVSALTRRARNGHDTVQQLAMDLQWELKRLQANVTSESIDGAQALGLTEPDRILVRAFMKGINETARLAVDPDGFRTIATRHGDRLSIQNDLRARDVHLFVVHVTPPTTAVSFTDRHSSRIRFFHDLLRQHDISWETTAVAGSAGYKTTSGRYTAGSQEQLERFLTRLGSRLVFLIDWNRAHKRLSQLVRSSDAIELLKWAADNDVGHRAFLQAGDVQLIYTALERAAPTQMRPGARLDDLLGREAARMFLMAVLRIASAGMCSGRSPRLIDDEIEAALLPLLQRSDRTIFGSAADLASVIAASVDWIGRAVTRLKNDHANPESVATVSAIRAWRSRADEIVRRAIRMMNHSDELQRFRQLMSDEDQAVKALEQTAFTLTLMPPEIDPAALSLLDSLCGLVSGGVRDYVQCLEEARDLINARDRSDLERFLVTVDRLVGLEEHCDAAERSILQRLVRSPGDFRALYLVSSVAGQLDGAFDSLVRSCLIVRDHVLGLAPGA